MQKLQCQEIIPRTAPKNLMILLHGLGSDGNDLISLAEYFSIDNCAFISPNAPFHCDMAPFGYQWFSLLIRDEKNILAGIQKVAPILNDFIDEQLKRFNLTDDKLFLAGFSQGGMMSTYVAPRRTKPCAGVISFSGALIAPELLRTEIKSHPKTLLIHGDLDDVVPPAALSIANNALKENDVEVEAHMIRGLSHGINEEALLLANKFLENITLNY